MSSTEALFSGTQWQGIYLKSKHLEQWNANRFQIITPQESKNHFTTLWMKCLTTGLKLLVLSWQIENEISALNEKTIQSALHRLHGILNYKIAASRN